MRTETQNWKSIGQTVDDLVQRIRRLCPDHRNPHHFHEKKSEIAHELTKLTKRVS